jgi:hypothetical protein
VDRPSSVSCEVRTELVQASNQSGTCNFNTLLASSERYRPQSTSGSTQRACRSAPCSTQTACRSAPCSTQRACRSAKCSTQRACHMGARHNELFASAAVSWSAASGERACWQALPRLLCRAGGHGVLQGLPLLHWDQLESVSALHYHPDDGGEIFSERSISSTTRRHEPQ